MKLIKMYDLDVMRPSILVNEHIPMICFPMVFTHQLRNEHFYNLHNTCQLNNLIYNELMRLKQFWSKYHLCTFLNGQYFHKTYCVAFL